MRILAIESSCDETAAAVVESGERVLSSVVASQLDTHGKYGGVASRAHQRLNDTYKITFTKGGATTEAAP